MMKLHDDGGCQERNGSGRGAWCSNEREIDSRLFFLLFKSCGWGGVITIILSCINK